MTKKPRILITNDDGIDAPGIRHLWKALSGIGELIIIAPTTQRSGAGMCLTIDQPLFIHDVRWETGTRAWKINGTPADCIRFALSVLLDSPPDLIVSGINRGANSGRNVLYSGTVGGVMEGTLRGICGIAFSCENFINPDYGSVEKYVRQLTLHYLENPMPHGTLLNVNFPDRLEIKGIKMASQGRGYWIENPEKRLHPDGDIHYYWHGLKWGHHDEHEESDVSLLKEGYATVVPIQVTEMTDHHFLSNQKESFDKKFTSS